MDGQAFDFRSQNQCAFRHSAFDSLLISKSILFFSFFLHPIVYCCTEAPRLFSYSQLCVLEYIYGWRQMNVCSTMYARTLLLLLCFILFRSIYCHYNYRWVAAVAATARNRMCCSRKVCSHWLFLVDRTYVPRTLCISLSLFILHTFVAAAHLIEVFCVHTRMICQSFGSICF